MNIALSLSAENDPEQEIVKPTLQINCEPKWVQAKQSHLWFPQKSLSIYLYKTEVSETPIIFHVNNIYINNNKFFPTKYKLQT